MSITYPLSLPSNKIKRIDFYSLSAVGAQRSQFTFARQVHAHSGMMWGADITLAPMERTDASAWNAFLLSLNGQEGTFLLGDPLAGTPLGMATGTPQVNGGGQTGQSLVTDGWTTSTTDILKAGDYIQLGTGSSAQLYCLLNDADSNGSGQATLDIWPRLRTSPVDNASIIVNSCKGNFCLSGNQVKLFSADETKIYDIVIQCMESL